MQGVPTAGEEMEQLTNVPFAWRYTFTTMLIPAYDKITLKMTSAQAGLDQVMVAAETYAAENLARLPLLTDVYSSLEATLRVRVCMLFAGPAAKLKS